MTKLYYANPAWANCDQSKRVLGPRESKVRAYVWLRKMARKSPDFSFAGTRHRFLFVHSTTRSSQVGAIHPLYLYSAMSDMSLPTLSCGRRASAPTSQDFLGSGESISAVNVY
jgi:hypothetical protein